MELLVSNNNSGAQGSRWLLAHCLAVFAFLYLPIAVLIIYSFNGAGVGGFPPHDFTLNWYRILFDDAAIWDSVGNSLLVAFAAMVIALAFGIPAALALDRAHFPGKALFRRLVLLPLILPGIITGLSSTDALQCLASETQPADHHARPRHSIDLGRNNRSICGIAKT